MKDDADLTVALERLAIESVGLTVRALSDVAVEADLTLAQWRALVVIDAMPGSRMSTIAGRVGMSLPSMSRLVRRLERGGAVIVSTDPSDRRATVVHPTQAGSALRTIVAERRRALLAEALGDRRAENDGVVRAALEEIADGLEAFARS